MARQCLAIGTFGDIGFRSSPNGRVLARTWYRDWDGKPRLVQATGDTRTQAERALKAKLAERSLFQPTFTTLTADSPLTDLVAYLLEDIELEDRLSKTTRNLYERNMRTLVLPVLGYDRRQPVHNSGRHAGMDRHARPRCHPRVPRVRQGRCL